MPICPHSECNAMADDPTTWASYMQAAVAYESQDPHAAPDGVGFVVRVKTGIVGIDLDHVLGDGGELCDWAREIVAAIDSYTEWSPSGRGPAHLCPRHLAHGAPQAGDVEAYVASRYLTVTGNLFGAVRDINERTEALAQFHRTYLENDPLKPSTPKTKPRQPG